MVNYLTKKEKKQLINLVQNVNIKDEDSVWDLGIELSRWSIRLQAKVLTKCSDNEQE